MKSLKNKFAAFTLVAAMVFGTTIANGGTGIIIAKAVGNDKPAPCQEQPKDDSPFGIIIASVGIIIAKVGVIIVGAKEDPNDTCGIIIA